MDNFSIQIKKQKPKLINSIIALGSPIVDILAESDEVLSGLLSFAINLGYEWECSKVKLWLTSDRFKKTLEKNGFVYGEHPFAMTVWNQDLDLSKSYITMVDSDIF